VIHILYLLLDDFGYARNPLWGEVPSYR